MPTIIETLRLANAPAPWYINARAFSQAEVLALNATPIDVVPAPGANKVVVLLNACIACETTVAFANNPTFQFRYAGLVSNNMAIGVGLNAITKRLGLGLAQNNAFFGFSPGAVIPINRAIQLMTTTALTPGGTLQDFTCVTVYSVLDMPNIA